MSLFSALAGNLAKAPRIVSNIIKGAEGAFVGATNALDTNFFGIFRAKAKNASQAVKKLFPYANDTADRLVSGGEIEKLVTPDFYKKMGMKSHNPRGGKVGKLFGQTVDYTDTAITQQDLIDNAVDAKAAASLKGIKVQQVQGGSHAFTRTVADERRFSPNKSMVKKGVAALGVGSAAVGLIQGLPYQTPDPTVYYDGTNIRNINDMGANASYGRAIMGRNSRL
jgi:hypothetical protein